MTKLKLKRAVIKEEFVAITGDYKLALLLNQMLYWQERVDRDRWERFVEEEQTRNHNNPEELDGGWIYKTAEELADELMLGVTKSTSAKYLKELLDTGYVFRRRNPNNKWDKTYQYRVNLIKIMEDLESEGYYLEGFNKISNIRKNSYDSENERSLKNKPRRTENELRSSKNKLRNSKNRTAIPETTTETTTEITFPETTKKNLSAKTTCQPFPANDWPPPSKLPRNSQNHRQYPKDFEDIYKVYPDRPSEDKGRAYKKVRARLNEGISIYDLSEAAMNYRKYCEIEDKIGTQYVKMMATFFGSSDAWVEFQDYDFEKLDKNNQNITTKTKKMMERYIKAGEEGN